MDGGSAVASAAVSLAPGEQDRAALVGRLRRPAGRRRRLARGSESLRMAVPSNGELVEASVTGVPTGVTADDVTRRCARRQARVWLPSSTNTTPLADSERAAGKSWPALTPTTLRRTDG